MIIISEPNIAGLFLHAHFMLHLWEGDREATGMLTEAGAEVETKGEQGFTPLIETIG